MCALNSEPLLRIDSSDSGGFGEGELIVVEAHEKFSGEFASISDMQQVRSETGLFKSVSEACLVGGSQDISPVGFQMSEVSEANICFEAVDQSPSVSATKPALGLRVPCELAD
jgi:hypothetical protein